MSYLVLSLKYRPQTFNEVVGQDHITQTLTNAFKKDRISQGYLFTGPRGVGKTTTARLVAKALNCKETPGNPCNKCSNCMEITDGRNMDVLEIDGASNRGIEEIRGLRDAIQYAPINSKFKVFIIDEVHMLTTPAFNALLRTLEEPPSHGKFILATTDIYKVPATIISRCQRFDFNSISVQTISKQIQYVLEAEKIVIDEESLRVIAQKADGSMRDALSILDQVIAYSGENITIESVNKVLGLIPTDVYFNLLDSIKLKNGESLIKTLTDVKTKGMPLQDFVSGLNRHIRNMIIATVENGLNNIELNNDLKQKYRKSSADWCMRDLLRISKVITDIEPQIKRATQPFILVELSLLKLLEFDSTVTIESIINGTIKTIKPNIIEESQKINRIENLSKESPVDKTSDSIENHPNRAKEPAPSKTIISNNDNVTKKEITNSILLDKWDEFIGSLASERPTLGTLISQSDIGNINGNRLEIKLVNGNNFNLRSLEKNKIIIEKFLKKTYDTPLKTVFLMTKSENSNDDKEVNIVKKNTIKTNKTTAELIELFDGEILT